VPGERFHAAASRRALAFAVMASKPKPDPKQFAADVRKYIAALPPPARKRMQQVRALVRSTVPGAVEHFSYGIPGFKLDGQPLVWYAAFKAHTSLYPITPPLLRALKVDVSAYETSKGTIRFPLSKPLPAPLVKVLVRGRAADARERAATKKR
jgi:uncharacterized protein YdhG (YjbR/CyaY superfamily)